MFKSYPIMATVAAMVLLGEVIGQASILTPLSGSLANVLTIVSNAQPGDIIQLPPGTNTWTQTVNLNGVSIRGAGTNQTIIIDEVSRANNGGELFVLNGNLLRLTELSNLQLVGGVTNTSYNYYGAVVGNGLAPTQWRIDHVVFNGLYAKDVVTYGDAYSLVDHNTFFMRAEGVVDNSYSDAEGDQSWQLPPTYGQQSAGPFLTSTLYIEDNFFTNIIGTPAGVCDGEVGARVVFRYNIIWNDFFANHGTETGGRWRSERSFEVYNNAFNYSPSAPGYPFYTFANIRGGSGVIYSNTATGYTSIVGLRDFRYTDAYSGQWYPFGGANGTNAFDSNSPTIYLRGTSSGPAGASYLQVAGVNWTNNQWVGYSLNNLNSGYFSVIYSNNANMMFYLGAGLVQSHPPMTFNPGDPFAIYQVYATLDQPGRGSGDLLADAGMTPANNEYVINTAFGVPAYPRQALEPIYTWSNTINGTLTGMFSPYPGIQLNRDFYNDTPKPGYVPYSYPHPLAISPTPPSNLKAEGH